MCIICIGLANAIFAIKILQILQWSLSQFARLSTLKLVFVYQKL